MSKDFLNSNPLYLRACVLYHSSEKKPIFESFKEFSNVVGPEAMDYQEFEFWFRRFENGLTDLSYDRSLAPKHPELLELPNDILERIVEEVKREGKGDRSTIRKVCKKLKEVSNTSKNHFESASLRLTDFCLELEIDKESVAFECESPLDEYDENIPDYVMSNKGFSKVIREIRILMNMQKLKFEKFEVSICVDSLQKGHESWYRMVELFKEIRSHVTGIEFRNGENLTEFLECFEPGKLEKVIFESYFDIGSNTFRNLSMEKEMLETEQWKRAKVIRSCCTDNESLAPEHFAHFNDIHLQNFRDTRAVTKSWIQMALKSAEIQRCQLTFKTMMTAQRPGKSCIVINGRKIVFTIEPWALIIEKENGL